MPVNPICILRGLCNSISVLVCYDIGEWINPKLWSNGFFSIYLLRDNCFGHKYIEVLAESLAEFETDKKLPLGTYSLQLQTRIDNKLTTYFELCGPYSPEIRDLSQYIFKISKEWGYEPSSDSFLWVDENGEEYDEKANWKYIVDVEDTSDVSDAKYTIQSRLEV